MFGTAGELRLDPNKKPVILDVDKEELAHPSVCTFIYCHRVISDFSDGFYSY